MALNSAKVDTNAMRAGAQATNQASENISTVQKQVDTTMDSLFGTWQSDATVVFGQAMESVNQIFQSITARLRQLAETINAAAQNYDSQDESNSATARTALSRVSSVSGASSATGLSGF